MSQKASLNIKKNGIETHSTYALFCSIDRHLNMESLKHPLVLVPTTLMGLRGALDGLS